MKEVDYKFNEDQYLDEIREYIDTTYTQHYSGKYQATDMIIDAGHGVGFCIGSIIKYAKRYGKKEGYNRRDIQKIIHYGIILLHVHDMEHAEDLLDHTEEYQREIYLPDDIDYVAEETPIPNFL